ncbi:MAG: hypothetical protein JWM89_3023 [Acidimicrobiales bacterium]|nr:hypothetical protein [Acidimicrobiales bacterium]
MSPARPPRCRLGALVLAIGLVVAAAGCTTSEGSDGASPRQKPDIGSAATLQATTSTAGDTTTTATKATVPATTGVTDALEAAQKLYDAWKAGDHAGAAQVATQEAVDGIWATPPGDYAPYNHCDTGEFTTGGCLFRGNSGTIQFDLEKRGDLWVVVGAVFAEP